MHTDQFIYSEEFIRGRIYSYLRFQKYMTKIAEIVCKELDMDIRIADLVISIQELGLEEMLKISKEQ